jgi:hypothetical protein
MFGRKQGHIIVYLDAKQNYCGVEQAKLKKVVQGTDRAAFFLALIRNVTSPRVSYHPMNKSK